jgi:hypothetical protein
MKRARLARIVQIVALFIMLGIGVLWTFTKDYVQPSRTPKPGATIVLRDGVETTYSTPRQIVLTFGSLAAFFTVGVISIVIVAGRYYNKNSR